MLSEIEKSYLAGAMDADGWFCIKQVRPSPKYPHRKITYFVFVGFCQVQKEVPEMLYREYGGSLNLRNRKPTKRKSNGWKPNYYWTTTSQKANKLIRDLLPYLKVKKDQAELCIQMQDSIDNNRYSWVKNGFQKSEGLNDNIINQRTDIYQKLLQLHDNRIIKKQLF